MYSIDVTVFDELFEGELPFEVEGLDLKISGFSIHDFNLRDPIAVLHLSINQIREFFISSKLQMPTRAK